ncbi:MAG: hypothetical protein KKH04_14555 [Proteobacteria bacterium]|nr:hypothetical protein [Pseudomonadota bacterium]
MEQKKILIVDDDGSMRHMLSLILKREGYEVQAVGKGSEALRRKAEQDCLPFWQKIRRRSISVTCALIVLQGKEGRLSSFMNLANAAQKEEGLS